MPETNYANDNDYNKSCYFDVTDGSHLMILHLITIDDSRRQDHITPTTKLDKVNVSVYPSIVLVSIVLLLFEF